MTLFTPSNMGNHRTAKQPFSRLSDPLGLTTKPTTRKVGESKSDAAPVVPVPPRELVWLAPLGVNQPLPQGDWREVAITRTCGYGCKVYASGNRRVVAHNSAYGCRS